MNKISSTINRKVGKNRDRGRIWIEGKSLEQAGWVRGTGYAVTFEPGTITYKQVNDTTRKVAGKAAEGDKPGRPIIDTNHHDVERVAGFAIGSMVSIRITPTRITITAA